VSDYRVRTDLISQDLEPESTRLPDFHPGSPAATIQVGPARLGKPHQVCQCQLCGIA
jgi:hypothetical protein